MSPPRRGACPTSRAEPLDGTLSITMDGATTLLGMDDAACGATDVRVKVIERIKGHSTEGGHCVPFVQYVHE